MSEQEERPARVVRQRARRRKLRALDNIHRYLMACLVLIAPQLTMRSAMMMVGFFALCAISDFLVLSRASATHTERR